MSPSSRGGVLDEDVWINIDTINNGWEVLQWP